MRQQDSKQRKIGGDLNVLKGYTEQVPNTTHNLPITAHCLLLTTYCLLLAAYYTVQELNTRDRIQRQRKRLEEEDILEKRSGRLEREQLQRAEQRLSEEVSHYLLGRTLLTR